jgi:hypothetical protein
MTKYQEQMIKVLLCVVQEDYEVDFHEVLLEHGYTEPTIDKLIEELEC